MQKIRRVDASELKEVLALCEQLHDLHNPEDFDEEWKSKKLASFLNAPTAIALVAGDTESLGYLLGEVKEEEYGARSYLHIRELFVVEAARRHGIGGALIEEALKWGRSNGCSYASLDVREENVDREFYNSVAFHTFSRTLRRHL